MDIFLTVAEKIAARPRYIRRNKKIQVEVDRRRDLIVDYYTRNSNLPIDIIAKELDFTPDIVSRYITAHLCFKFGLTAK